MSNPFLPVSKADLAERHIDQLDFVFVSGDAYVDHPSFAAALLGRLLEANGYTVGIIPQPDISTADSFKVLGQPKLAFLVSAGAMDSMVCNYTANNKPRSEDAYSHGGVKGKRPDRALIQYCSKIREAYKGVPLLIGGIEASLRRTTHYDYWSNTIKHSVLLDSKADLLMYGMGEHSLLEIAALLKSGVPVREIRGVRGTVWFTGKKDQLPDYVNAFETDESTHRTIIKNLSEQAKKTLAVPHDKAILLPCFEDIKPATPEGKELFARSFAIQEQNTDAINAHVLIEGAESRYIVQEPPAMPLTTEEFDRVMELPYTRKWHPMYDGPAENGKCGIPGLEEVKFSLVSSRGCFGACSFCAITFHQGRRIQARSHQSLVREATLLTKDPDFKGYIHDVGGPTANFRRDACDRQKTHGACPSRQCLDVHPCKNLVVDHTDYVELLRKLRAVPGVKKVFIRSGIRFDYLMMDKDKTFFKELCLHHISGQLKVAPEHANNYVLSLMRKSNHELYLDFEKEYRQMNNQLGLKQYIVPYYIACHPGAGLNEAIDVALHLKKNGFVPDQVQDFYPTPGNLATTMYYTGLDPYHENDDGSLKEVYVARGAHERRLQRALLQFNRKENRSLVKEALIAAGRKDLLNVLI